MATTALSAELVLDPPVPPHAGAAVPGDLVRFRHESGWWFGRMMERDGRYAVVRASRSAESIRIAMAEVRPWPPRA